MYRKCKRESRKLVGHNCNQFDVPFVVRRSWLFGIDIPESVFDRGRWLDQAVFADTMQIWAAGTREWAKLDSLARAFEIGGKPEGMDGSMFWKLIASECEDDRQRAEEYLANDLRMTRAIAERMGLV